MQNRNHAAHAAAPRAPRRRAARGVAALGLTAGLLVPMGIAGADTAFASEPGESGNPDAGEAASLQEGSGQAPLTLDDAADRLAEAQGAYDQAEQRLAEEESQAQTAQAAQAAPGDAEGPAAGSAQLAQAGAEAQGAEPTSESAEPTEGGRAGAPNAAAAAGIDATQEAPSAAQGAQGDAEAEAVAETEPAAASAGAKAQAAAQEADGAKQPAAGADAAVPAANGAKQTAEARTNAPAAGDAPTPAGAAATAGLTAEQAQARYDQGAFAFYESVGADAALDILENCAYAGYVDRGGEASATSLANMLAAVEQLRELNALRASAGLPEYKVTYELLAMAQAQADYVAQRFEHNGQFLEQASNLYWGNAENIAAHTDDPQQGWYHAEKRAWDEAVAKNPALAKMSAVEVYKAYPDLYARTG
ncbi:MAG: hypothetical protein Q4F08_11390, partial [Rikenellaceae bacterium]|nr:hypothetical protein [Rikenellaceae bacterium]